MVEVVVTAGHTTTTDIQFTYNTHGQFVAVLVNDEFLHIELWFTDRHQFSIGQFLVVRSYGNLRRTIAVEDSCLSNASHLCEQLVGEFFTAGPADGYVGDGLAEVGAGEPSLPAGWCSRNHIDVLLVDKRCQVERVVGLLFGSNNQRLAVVESHTDVLKGSVEGDGCDAEHALGIGQHTVGKHIGGMTIEIVADAFVAEHHSLGAAR